MELFHRRPLCFFCTLFALVSVLAIDIGFTVKLYILAAMAVVCAVIAVWGLKNSKHISVAVYILLCAVFVAGAVANSALRIDYPKMRAERYIGTGKVVMDISGEGFSSSYASAYNVKIRQADGDKTDFHAVLVCGFGTDLEVGDRLYANAALYSADSSVFGISADSVSDSADCVLLAAIYTPEDALVERFNRDAPLYRQIFARNGLAVSVNRMKAALEERMSELFGEKAGALVNGFLLGNTSKIETDDIRNFRRAGVSHLLAVSGLHISILLGSLDLFLKKLYVHKTVRCVTVSATSIIFLALTGFAMSAVRAVFMLWIMYIIFIFSEEADSPTSLLLAVTVILTVSPHAVYEVGMWMSFLATLGLVTVYPIFEKVLPRSRRKHRLVRKLFGIPRAVLLTVAMTVTANLFLLPIQWKLFGEISLASIPANIILSPLTTLYIIASVIALITGDIPFVGAVLTKFVNAVSNLLLWILEKMAYWKLATVSLKYGFCGMAVIIFTAAMLVFLAVKLPRKWLLAVPGTLFAAVLCVGVLLFELFSPSTVTYRLDGTHELISLSVGKSLCIVDVSDGTSRGYAEMLDNAGKQGAVDVDMIVFTNITQKHISSMRYFMRSNVVREIYIPMPNTDGKTEKELAADLIKLACECNVEVFFYDSGDKIKFENTVIAVNIFEIGGARGTALFVGGEEKIFGYADMCALSGEELGEIKQYIYASDVLIIGNSTFEESDGVCVLSDGTELIYSSVDVMNASNIVSCKEKTYYNCNENIILEFELE